MSSQHSGPLVKPTALASRDTDKRLRQLEYIESWPPMRPLQGDSEDDFIQDQPKIIKHDIVSTCQDDATWKQAALPLAQAPTTISESSLSSSSADINEDSSIVSRFSCAILKAFCAT